ncbi:MAG: hypothetical protein K5770_03860 [Lachnospiraceae bacterium]|nr:hypothetical protein [Lachnospiraceae bacterium]
MRNDCETKQIVVGLVLVVAGAIIIPIFIREITRKAYKSSSIVTEKEFANNGPEIVRKTEDEANDY